MTGGGESTAGKQPIPRFGKDHLTLADWRTGVLRFQQPRGDDGSLPPTLAAGFERPDGPLQQVLLERGAASEFPTVSDEDVILGLIYLASEQGFPNVVQFMPSRLVEIIRWPKNQKSYQRVRRSLERYKKLTATFTGNWYDRSTRSVLATLVTGVVAQAEIVTARGRMPAGQLPRSHVQWTENFAASLREGNLVDIDLELLFSWRRPGAKVLHRHLNKVWHGGRKPRVYERDLKELACGHLGMKDLKDLKRNFQNLVAEMEERRYLAPMSVNHRYQKMGVGNWRVRLGLHPDRLRPERRRAQTKRPDLPHNDDARAVVQAYHRFRFACDGYEPLSHELEKAASLLATHDLASVMGVTRSVAEKVSSQRKDDVYFGFAVPYYQKVLQKQLQAKATFAHQASAASVADSDRQRVQDLQARRREERAQRLRVWKGSNSRDMKAYVESALSKAASNAVRNRILDSTHDDPAPEVLREIPLTPIST